jgi:HAE1 family hydrophobic/amphiphilic exporter-1
MSLARLRYASEKELKKLLESTDGVAAIKVIGGLEEQIRIEIDEKKLAELGVPISEVTTVLAEENLNQASGSLYDLEANYLVRILNQFRDVDEIRNIIIRNQDGRRIVLGDIAHVERGVKDRDIIARLNGAESVELAIYKEADANSVSVSEAVQQRLRSLEKAGMMPRGLKYQVVFNQADFIKMAIDDVLSSALMGGLLAILVLFIFLRDLRSTLIIAFTIPVSILGTFGLMYQMGISLNLMSLGGVALAVGMLVDNSIVVLESVHRYKLAGLRIKDAVLRGTREVTGAMVASTLTSVAVFLPLIFVIGVAGQLFRDQALTITFGQLVSLVVGFSLTPMILALSSARHEVVAAPAGTLEERPLSNRPALRRVQQGTRWAAALSRRMGRFLLSDMMTVLVSDVRSGLRAVGRLINKILSPGLNAFETAWSKLAASYPPVLDFALRNKAPVILSALVLLLFSGWLATRIGAELIPSLTQGEFSFEVRLPEGKALAQTDAVMKQLEMEVAKMPDVKLVYSSIGGSNKNQFALNTREEHIGQLYVTMRDKNDKRAEALTIERIRARLAQVPEVAYTFGRPTLFSVKTPVEVEIYAYDLEDQRQAASLIASRMTRIPGLSDIRTSTEDGNPEIQVRFDRERLARLGLDEGRVANLVRTKIRGDVASRFREDDKQIEILVRAQEQQRSNVKDVENLLINVATSGNGGNREIPQPGEEQQRAFGANNNPASSNGGRAQVSERPAAQTEQRASDNRNVPVRLGAIADVVVARGPAEVRRIRSQRAAVVSANLTGRDLSSVTGDLQLAINSIKSEIPAGATVNLGGQNEEMMTSYRSLMFALTLAVFLVYIVMASTFESLIHPFVILFSVPFALVGVVLSLAITGTTVNVMVLLGLIILVGIVVNNAIVLIDYTNQLRSEGLSRREALKKAGEVRLRPIMMTTLTSVLGLVPMALGWGEGAEIRSPMAITIIGGLSFGTLLTLVFVPVVYEIIDHKRYAADAVAAPEPEYRFDPQLGQPAEGRAGD